MSEFFKIIAMSVLQGLTEFLPVSSSGHLALAGHFLGVKSPGATLELFLHGGTLFSVVLFYRRKLWQLAMGVFRLEKASLLYTGWVLVSMVPAGALYVFAGDDLESSYDSPMFVAAMLCVTGLMLVATDFLARRRVEGSRRFGWVIALVMGIAQAVAMLPGISRSGSTISAGRLAGASAAEAAEFSFIMSLPVIGGAFLVNLLKGGASGGGAQLGHYIAGAVVAAFVGCLSIGVLVRVLNRGKLWMFGVYCLVVGCAAMVLLRAGV